MGDNYHSLNINKPVDNVNPFTVSSQKQTLIHSKVKNENNPQDLSIYNSQENNINLSMKPLPSMEGFMTNPTNSNSFELNRACGDSLYNFIDKTPQNMKQNLYERQTHEFAKTVPSIRTSNNSINLHWEKPKAVNVHQPSASNTSYGLVTHVLEQHFGLKEQQQQQEYVENVNLTQRNDASADAAIGSSQEPQMMFAENKDGIPDQDYDSDSTSSSESITLTPEEEEDKDSLTKCNECDVYIGSKGSLKVHMRLHTGIYPYICKECGESFPSCNLFYAHKTEHEAIELKSFSCNECGKRFNCEKHFKHDRKKHLVPKMFHCFECKQSFATKDRLMKHSKLHFGETSLFCDKCGKVLANKLKYDEHKLAHMNGNWKCEDCDNYTSGTPHQLEKHILNVHHIHRRDDIMQPIQISEVEDNKRFMCEICSLKFENISNYYIHRCNHKNEKTFKCDTCNASYFKEFHLFVHSATHNTSSFNCNMCDMNFNTKKALQIHMQKNEHKLPFGCFHCDFSFKEESELNTHMKTHCGDKPFSCDQCDATFRHSSTLKIHQRIHTGDTPFICPICQASFIQNHHLQIHLRSHSSNKPYKCTECEASFTKRDYLIAHRTKHITDGADLIAASIVPETNLGSGITTLQCTFCEMNFSHQSTLAAHIRKHTGERPFVCDKCGASFLYSSNLTTHRRKHTGERPYKCKECDASFTLKSYLTMHLRKHSGERPFKCDICESCFTQKTHLSTHRRIHTGEYPYKCDICGDAFRDGANFWRHKKRHSDESQNPKSSDTNNSEGKSRPARVKKLRTKNSGGGKVVPSTPSFISHHFVEEPNTMPRIVEEDKLSSFMNKEDNSYDQVLEAVKSETYA